MDDKKQKTLVVVMDGEILQELETLQIYHKIFIRSKIIRKLIKDAVKSLEEKE
jgi:metal-responsive CopG/Arc/MetJ family transcriptional regulator